MNSINDHQAASLGKINDLALDGLTSISPEQLKHLTNNGFDLVHQRYNSAGAYLKLNGLTGFEDRHAEILSRSISRTTIQLNGLKSPTEKQAVLIGALKLTLGGTLHLAGLLSLSDEQTEHLSSIPGLYLDGLTSISNAQAKSLSQLGGEYRAVLLKPNRLILPISVPTPYLSLDGLHSINETQARYLTGGLTGLSLGGLKSLTQTQAALLSRMKGLYVPYDLQPMIDESRTPDAKQKSQTDQD